MNLNEKYTPFKEAKYCFVPSCKNNSIKHKEKMFFVVPSASKQDWCKAVGVDCPKRSLYICEDHLNLKEDITNYMYWSTMRGRPKLKASLPQSLLPNISPLREPQPSTSSAAIPMEIDSVTENKMILFCNKGVQVKPKMADRTTNCSLSKIKTAPLSFCQDDDDFNSEQIDIDDAIPSTQDCFEIEIEKPSKPIEQSLTWSQYKNANTLKYLLASTPDGFIVFVSAGHGGRISDTNIVEVSRFLDVLPPNCSILADRGFKHIDTLLTKKGIKLLRPPSVAKNVKLTKKEAIQSKVIASLRIHIERVIRRIRLFKLLKPHSVINNKLIQYIDEVVTIACGLINLQSSIVKNC
ncbi:unnamed protein product [Colias eurytheme]|nr:unnamed protein product [Colias eurytheme]